MRRRIPALAISVAVALTMSVSPLASVGFATQSTDAGCVRAPLESAAAQLVHPQAEVSSTASVAGFDSALTLEPLVYPGVRHRLVRAGDLWCGAEGFNTAWRAARHGADAVEMASAYVQLAAAPYFDGVTVRRAVSIIPGIVSLETHAQTNGVTARWTVAVDAHGIQHASWTSTGFAVAPFTAEWEGVTALPGVSRSYARGADGVIAALEPILPQPSAPEVVTEGQTADDFTLRVSYSRSGLSPNAGQDTGVDPVDYLRFVRQSALDNYQEFYDWGFRKDWKSEVGTIYIDSEITPVCMACVFIDETFNIHLSSAVVQFLYALGFEYPDDKQAFTNILGHEMTHNWQNAYYKPEQNDTSAHVALIEGTARFQEALHSYSEVSHQPLSLVYHTESRLPGLSVAANSCNGWAGDNTDSTFARGPFTNKTYNACYFWLSWYQAHGTDGIVQLFTALRDNVTKPNYAETIDTLQQATGGTFAADLAAFARASITGKGYEWAAPGTDEPVRDWGQYLQRWSPKSLAVGTTATATLRNGGIIAREISDGGYPTLESLQPGAALAVIRADADTAQEELIEFGDCIDPPAAGEQVWITGIYPEAGSSSVTIGLHPLPAGQTECPQEDDEASP